MAAGYRWHVGQLTTGKIWSTFEVSSGTWSTSFDYGNAGAIDFSVPLRALSPDKTSPSWREVRAQTATGKAFAAVSYVDKAGTETFLEAGPIWKRKWSRESGILTIGANGLQTYFDKRKAIDSFTTDPYAEWSATYTGPQLGLIAKRYIELVQYDFPETPEFEWYKIPLVLPDDADLGGTTPATHTRTLLGYELAWLGTRLDQITKVIDGPEIQFVPRRRSDDPRYIEWVVRIGVQADNFLLTQDGPAWVFDTTIEKSPVRDMEVDEDGTEFASIFWAGGEGEAQGRPIARGTYNSAELLDVGYPLLEGEVTDTDSVSVLDTLQSHVDEAAQRYARPSEQWTLKVDRDSNPNLGKYRVGDWASVRIGADNEWVNEGTYPTRMLAMNGSADSSEVGITMAERVSAV